MIAERAVHLLPLPTATIKPGKVGAGGGWGGGKIGQGRGGTRDGEVLGGVDLAAKVHTASYPLFFEFPCTLSSQICTNWCRSKEFPFP